MNKLIKVKFKNEIISGILLYENEENIIIKLNSGYNSILRKDNLEIISIEKIQVIKKNNLIKLKKNNKLLNIKILHTGGTIASKVDYTTGGVSSKFTPEDLLNLYPELLNKVNLSAEMVGNLFSEDIRFSHYNLLLDKIIESIKEGFNAIIISHGTDTLHYTSVALQYAIENLSIPIILVGAQRSSDRPSSDAFSNLNAAIDFIIYNNKQKKRFLRVGVCMHSEISDDGFYIYDSINLKKLHSTRRDAFKQVNYLPYAKINYDKEGDFEVIVLRDELSKEKLLENKDIKINKYQENLKIGFFKTHPNLFPEEIKNLNFYNGIIIEGTGLGHISINKIDENTKIHNNNYEELKDLTENIPVIIATQTVYGQVNLNVYSTGRRLQELNIYGNNLNLNSETLFIRLAFCLSRLKLYEKYEKISFNKLWKKDLEKFKIRSNDI